MSAVVSMAMLAGTLGTVGIAMAGSGDSSIRSAASTARTIADAGAGDAVSGLGVALGSGVTVHVTETLDQRDVYAKALAHVIQWRRDALDDSRIRIERTVDGAASSWTIREYLRRIGMSEQEYLSPKWSNALERIAVQRAVEAADYGLHHTRPNGESGFTAAYNGVTSDGEILAWGGGDIAHAIDAQWASEKQDYISHLAGNDTGQTGHYVQLIDPDRRWYGFGQGTSPDWGHVFAGESSTSVPAGDSQTPTGWQGDFDVEVNVSDALLNQGVVSNLPMAMDAGATAQARATLMYLSGRYEFRGTWTSSDSSVAGVTADGQFKALRAGHATITVSGQGKRFIFPITVQSVAAEKLPVYRVYNPNSGLHHYTTSSAERDYLIRRGWRDEHVSFNAVKDGDSSMMAAPVYREYNPNDGNHNWTMSRAEHDSLIRHGWRDEDVAWYVDPTASIDVYRLYNPNSGEHVYTTNHAEYEQVQRAGWHGENIAWKSL